MNYLGKYVKPKSRRQMVAAYVIFNKAKKRGKIVPLDKCSVCGKKGKIFGHHHDYSKPLTVTWLCPKCHGQEHRKIGNSGFRTGCGQIRLTQENEHALKTRVLQHPGLTTPNKLANYFIGMGILSERAISLTERNEKFIRFQALKWATTPTIMANQLLAESIASRKSQNRRHRRKAKP